MTTTTTARPASGPRTASERDRGPRVSERAAATRPRRTAATLRSRRTARDSGLALVAALALAVPAVPALTAGPSTSALDVAASFLVVAGLELVVGRGLYVLGHERAHPAAYAALLSRAGHALLLVVAATLLAWRGPAGLPTFHDEWVTALAVLGGHLVVAGVVLWRARLAPRALGALVAVGGIGTLAISVVGGAESLVPAAGAALLAETALAAALLGHGLRRPAPDPT